MLHDQREPGTVSRRKLIITGTSLAAAGVAVGAVASIPFTATEDAESLGEGPDKPVMVYLRENGRFDVFVGQDRIQLTDRAFAARLTSAVKAI